MMDFLRNPRRVLIVVNDLFFTALALLATFYVRFENGGFYERLHWLLAYLPVYLIYAGTVYWLFSLYIGKWRFASLPDLWNILRAVTVLAVSLLILDYILLYPTLYGTYFFGKITIALYWLLQVSFIEERLRPYSHSPRSRTKQYARRSDAVPTLL